MLHQLTWRHLAGDLGNTKTNRLEDRCNGSSSLAQVGVAFMLHPPGQVKHEPDQYGYGKDVGTGLDQEVFAIFPGMQQQAGKGGHPVGGQLHDEHRCFTLEQSLFEDKIKKKKQ